jgi:hypothetical protein
VERAIAVLGEMVQRRPYGNPTTLEERHLGGAHDTGRLG